MTAVDTDVRAAAPVDVDDERLRALVAPHDGDGPGGVLLVAREGAVLSAVAFGAANLEHGVPNALDTVFYLASTSKQLVAAAAAVLELDGLLDPDEPVARWVPEVQALGDLRVSHLVHHTGGVRDKYSLGLLGRLTDAASATDAGTARLLAGQRGLNHEPGSRFMYSNSHYWLLAQVVERCSGDSLTSFADRRLFGPLGMTETRFRADPSEVVPRRATGYRPAVDGGWRTEEYTRASLGAGGAVSTAASLARWGRLFTAPEHALLGERLQRTRPLADGSAGTYAYGVVVGEHGGRRLLHHAGGVEGFGAEMLQVPDEGLTVVCLTNRPAPLAPLLARAALDLVLPAQQAPVAAAPSSAPSVALVGSYVDEDDTSVLTVRADGDDLVLAFQRAEWRCPAGATQWSGPLPLEVTGAADQLALRCGDQQLSFRRVPAGSAPAPEQLCGAYRSDELGVAVDVTHDADGFHLSWPDGTSAVLEPFAGDVQLIPFAEPVCTVVVRAQRDGDGQVAALRLSVARAIGVVFDRLPAG